MATHQYFCLENPMDGGAWQATVRRVAKSWTHLSDSAQQQYGLDLWVGKILWRRNWKPTPVFLPGELRGHRNLAGYSPWGCKELEAAA